MTYYKQKEDATLLQKVYYNLCFRVSLIFLLSAFLVLLLPLFPVFKYMEKEQFCLTSYEYRIDCLPHIIRKDQTENLCMQKKCCWNEHSFMNFPRCYHKRSSLEYYTANIKNNSMFVAKLVNKNQSTVTELNVKIEQWNNQHFRLVILPQSQKAQYSVPLKRPEGNKTKLSEKIAHLHQNKKLYFALKYKGRNIFNTSVGPMIFRENYIEISSFLPSYHIYGLGLSKKKKFGIDLNSNNRWSLYSRYNKTENIYFPSVHPFYLCMENNGKAHGVLISTSYPMEIEATAGAIITFRILGGILDIHFFLGPSPADVVSQMLKYVGTPSLPPYWALGHHVCSANISEAKVIAEQLRHRNIDQESSCIESLMYDYNFTLESIEELEDFAKYLHKNKQKLILLKTPHIPIAMYTSSDKKYYVMNSNNSEPYFGMLFNDIVIYPDFVNPNIIEWIKMKYNEIYNTSFDGFMLDFNTPVNSNISFDTCDNVNVYFNMSLSNDTICWNSLHQNGEHHYKTHNIYGHKHMETIWHYESERVSTRPFIISAATFMGSGKYGGQWGGRNFATWEALKQSVVDMLENSMYGIALTGSPYCGYYGELNQQLCARWLQIAAVSPLMIGYRSGNLEQLNLAGNSLVASVSRLVLRLRYSLLPYLYTLFYRASVNGSTVVRPVFFEFPNDVKTYHLNTQFMLGSALMISPVLQPNTEKVNAYFPKGCWYNYYDGSIISKNDDGETIELSAIESQLNLHILGGRIVPSKEKSLTYSNVDHKRNFILTIAVNCSDDKLLAKGELYIDDGESKNSAFILICIEAWNRLNTTTGYLNTWPCDSYSSLNDQNISYFVKTIRLFGLKKIPRTVKMGKIFVESNEDQFVIIDLQLNLRTKNTLIWNY